MLLSGVSATFIPSLSKSCRFYSQQHVPIARGHNFDCHPDVGLMFHRPIRKVSCSRETLASRYEDLVSPCTRPREFGISIKSSASSLCLRRPCTKPTNRKYPTQHALSMLNNRKTSASRYGDLVSPSTRQREFGISIGSIAWVLPAGTVT